MNVRLIFWIIVGIIWLISVIAKKRGMETKPPAGRSITGKPEGGDVYEAPEDELSRFLRMVSGEVIEEKKPEPKPGSSKIPEAVKEVKPVYVEPEPLVLSSKTGIPEAVSVPEQIPAGEISLPAFAGMSMDEVRKGIVLSEILGPPRAMKPY